MRANGVLRSWAGTTFASYATARDAEAPEEDGGLKWRPGHERNRERAHAEDCTRGALACQIACTRCEHRGLNGRKLSVKISFQPSVESVLMTLSVHPKLDPVLGETVREVGRKKGFSVEHLFKRSGVPWWVIHRIECESPSYVPSGGNTALLAEALRMPLGSLLGERDRVLERAFAPPRFPA
jgi:hypothetical protein